MDIQTDIVSEPYEKVFRRTEFFGFDEIVGQEVFKKQMMFQIRAYDATGILPNILLVAPKGSGKTMFADILADNLFPPDPAGGQMRQRKAKVIIPCAQIKNVTAFFTRAIIPYVVQSSDHFTFIFDEAHVLPKDVQTALLTILNPNKFHRNTFVYDNQPIDFDFRRLTFIFMTTDSQKMDQALKDRLVRMEIPEYKIDELAEILYRNLNNRNITVDDDLLMEIAGTVRINPRNAILRADEIARHCAIEGKGEFDYNDWASVKDQLSIMPHGLLNLELNYMDQLYRSGKPLRLQTIAAKMSMTPASLRADIEHYPNRLGFLETVSEGRTLSAAGMIFMRNFLALPVKEEDNSEEGAGEIPF